MDGGGWEAAGKRQPPKESIYRQDHPVYRVRVVFENIQGSPWLATHYFSEAGGSAAQAVTTVSTFWGAVDNVMGTAAQWRTEPDVSLIDATNGHLTGVVATTPGTGAGGLAADLVPIVSQGLVRWRTGQIVGDRELRGRTFIPALTETANSANGDLAAATNATILAAANAYIADANSIPHIWHRPDPGASNGTSAAVLTASVWNLWATMRSRRD